MRMLYSKNRGQTDRSGQAEHSVATGGNDQLLSLSQQILINEQDSVVSATDGPQTLIKPKDGNLDQAIIINSYRRQAAEPSIAVMNKTVTHGSNSSRVIIDIENGKATVDLTRSKISNLQHQKIT